MYLARIRAKGKGWVFTPADFLDLGSRTAVGLAPAIIEKDFWACWTLRQLFEWPEMADHLIFKGGTSLSKIWKAIRRFSEDLDVSLGREWLGFGGDHDPARAKSATQSSRSVGEQARTVLDGPGLARYRARAPTAMTTAMVL